MHTYDYRELISGTLLVAVGLFAGIYATRHYNLGTLQHIGPGMFPAMLGFLLAGIGVLIALRALFSGSHPRNGDGMSAFEVRPFVAVLAGIFAFSTGALDRRSQHNRFHYQELKKLYSEALSLSRRRRKASRRTEGLLWKEVRGPQSPAADLK
jgi:hypothetical protein